MSLFPMLNTPILLITFNRPDHTLRVLERILKAHPKDLYVFQDGAREGNAQDDVKCAEVRKVIEEVTSPRLTVDNAQCTMKGVLAGDEGLPTIHQYFSDVNLGCGPGPMTALNWFFSENEAGIILEDDAIPHLDFFAFAAEMLERYRHDQSVFVIGSMNIDRHPWGDGSYYFSMANRHLCAWATWKRAWQNFDLYAKSVSFKELDKSLKSYGCRLREREYWLSRLVDVQKDALGHSSWDIQFGFKIWMAHGKGIIPNVNLSMNIGFDQYATHGNSSQDLLSNRKTYPIYPLKIPTSEDIISEADREYEHIYIEPYEYGWSGIKRLPYRINKRIKRFFGIKGSWIKHIKK